MIKSFALIRPHASKLFFIGGSLLWPPNALVVVRNGISLLLGQPWTDYCRRELLTYDELIRLCLSWLKHSQDRVGSGGIGCYEFYRWTKGYPEVTGYTIPTFWDCYRHYGDADLAERALRMSEWELSVQRSEGGFEGGYEADGHAAVVFNTGQVLRGLVRTYEETKTQRYIDAAVRGADWILSVQEKDGSWARSNYKGMRRVYDSYVSAALVGLALVTGVQKYAVAARRNCEFVIQHQRENGWFELCDNTEHFNAAPITHTIAYTADGLLETGIMLRCEELIEAARKTTEKLMHLSETQPRFWGRYDNAWKRKANFVCLTGCAQLGIVMMRLYKLTGDPRYLNATLGLVDFLAYCQDLNSVGENRKGGLPGAYPIWGLYAPFKYPSWAGKFFVDLLLIVKIARSQN